MLARESVVTNITTRIVRLCYLPFKFFHRKLYSMVGEHAAFEKGALVSMDGFRIVCDLSAFLDGIQKRSFLYVDISKLYTISDLCMHIQTSFNIKSSVALMIDDTFLPFVENIKILRADDVVKVVDTGFNNSTNNGTCFLQEPEEGIKDSTTLTENVTVQAHTPTHRQKKIKKPGSGGNVHSGNNAQSLFQKTSYPAENVTLENPFSRVSKCNQRQMKKHPKPSEESIDHGLSSSIPQTNSVQIDQSIKQLVTNAIIADIPPNNPEASSQSRKRKRIRTRKRKPVASDMTPQMNIQQHFNHKPAHNTRPTYFEEHVDSHVLHIRFSAETNECQNNSLGHSPVENDPWRWGMENELIRRGEPVEPEKTTERYGNEMNGITRYAPESVAPLVVRRVKVEPSQPVQVETTRKFLQNPPDENDIVTFKIWKLDQNYCPQISGLIKAKVLNFCKDTQQVRCFILDGKDHCEQPNGKFSLDVNYAEDGSPEPPIIPDIMDFNWQEMLQVEIFL